MTDLDMLRTVLAVEEPDQDVVDRSRHQLQNHLRGGRARGRRTGWLTVGAVTVAAAAAVAVAVLPGTPPARQPTETTSGQDILLAAATAAEQSPDGSGTYWHLTITTSSGPGSRYEYWLKPDGQLWFRGVKTGGEVMSMPITRPAPFALVAVDLTLDQLRALPAEPDALKAWIADAVEHSGARTSAGELTASDRELATFESLISLVSTLPASPEVRAAAFRAIAAYPGVESLGPVPGGQGLLLPGGERLVVDPTTGRVNGTSVYITMDGAVAGVAAPNTATIDAEWTDTLPA